MTAHCGLHHLQQKTMVNLKKKLIPPILLSCSMLLTAHPLAAEEVDSTSITETILNSITHAGAYVAGKVEYLEARFDYSERAILQADDSDPDAWQNYSKKKSKNVLIKGKPDSCIFVLIEPSIRCFKDPKSPAVPSQG